VQTRSLWGFKLRKHNCPEEEEVQSEYSVYSQ
jgi:hypothetical protein